MYPKTLILVLLLYQLLVQTKGDNEICRSDTKETSSDILSSIQNIKKSIISFFTGSFAKLEKKRRQIKKAFRRFINEVFYNIPPCSLRFMKHNLRESDINYTPDLIAHDGYQVQTHTVLTPDGYLLTIHRIVSTTSINTISGDREIAILSHGLLGSSIDWILLGPKKALPYLLSDAGYDVWLPNLRGNKYSRTHMTKTADSAEYWNFSWHEIGLFDIPAIIDYVRETTGEKPPIHFLAYCMSGSALLVLLSSSQRYSTILKSTTLLAPLVYMDHVEGPWQYLAELYTKYKNNINTIMKIESEFKAEELFDNPNLEFFCKDNEPLCNNPLLLLGDSGKKNFNLWKKYTNISLGGSTKTIIHYLQSFNLQSIKSGQFQMFDWGESKNYVKYGRASPPPYHLFNVKVPLTLFSAINDSISTVSDLSKLTFHIPRIINQVIKMDNFSHLDFLWAESATQLIYFPIMKELQKK